MVSEDWPFFADTSTLYDSLPSMEVDLQKNTPITVLQRVKANAVKDEDPSIRVFVKRPVPTKSLTSVYETAEEGITSAGTAILENLLEDLNRYNIVEGLDAVDKKRYAPVVDIENILKKVRNDEYTYVNQVVRDLRYLLNYYNHFAENFNNVDNKNKELFIFITEMFSLKLRDFLIDSFPDYDFNDIKGDVLQTVGPLKGGKIDDE